MSAPMTGELPQSARFFAPDIRLYGEVTDDTFWAFREQLDKAGDKGDITIEVTTPGGDADAARRIYDDIRILEEHEGKTCWFAGRTTVYSAGVTIMSAFPRERRYLSRGATLMVHERKMNKDLKLESAMKASMQDVKQVLHQIETGLDIEHQGFRTLIEGSDVSFEEMCRRAAENWYIPAGEALRLRLVAGLF